MHKKMVALISTSTKTYPSEAPYNPGVAYPEYPFHDVAKSNINEVYSSLRQAFYLLGFDSSNYGSKNWNPLSFLVKPGETILLKPNLLQESTSGNPKEWMCVITHGSIIRVIIDYVYIALKGKGRIVICDGPQGDSDIELIRRRLGISEIQSLYKDEKEFNVEFYDLRKEFWCVKNGIIIDRKKLRGDPTGYVKFDLGNLSFLSELDGLNRKYYGAFYNVNETNKHHHNGKHEYLVSKMAINADVLINIPKLKTHKKVGVTLNLKNLVGINGDKNWLPHYCFGSPDTGGDQFPQKNARNSTENAIVTFGKKMLLKNNILLKPFLKYLSKFGYRVFGRTDKVVRGGNWFGNDTTWRMCLDLNRIVIYGNDDGILNEKKTRKRYLSVVDGIVGMEGNGPANGSPNQSGLIAVGIDPLNVDLVCARLMGYDYKKIKLLANSFTKNTYPLYQNAYERIQVVSNIKIYNRLLKDISFSDVKPFKPHFGWLGAIEYSEKNHIDTL